MKKALLLFLFQLTFVAFAQMPQAEFENILAIQLGNDQQKAISSLEAAEKKYPGTDKVYFLRGVYQYRDGDNNAALMSQSNAIKANPKFALGYDARAELLFMRGMYDKAIADASRAIELEPNNVDFIVSRFRSYRANKQYKEALADAKLRIRVNPKGEYGYYDAAVVSKEADANYNADIFFEQAYANKDIDRHIIDVLFGQFMISQGRFDEARQKYETALAAGDDYFGTEDLHNLAITYYKTRQYDKALLYFKKVIAQIPQNTDFRNNMAAVYEAQQNWQLLKETALANLAINSEDPWANKYYAIGLANTGQESLANEYNEKAIRLGKEQSEK
ncbi:tetratricopeptide repeat protein [Flavobacterium sp.]|uniref:tetratricopeptide repeat protein n=1 Tax=Flavobacterium sp. TaxID=239 RepID=UPI004033A857